MTANQQQRAEDEHRGSLAVVVEVGAENRGDEHGQQGENGEDGLSRLAHVAHVAVGDEGDDADGQQAELVGTLLLEVGGEAGSSDDEHDDVLHDGDARRGPERTGIGGGQREIALQHVDGVLLEGEDG